MVVVVVAVVVVVTAHVHLIPLPLALFYPDHRAGTSSVSLVASSRFGPSCLARPTLADCGRLSGCSATWYVPVR